MNDKEIFDKLGGKKSGLVVKSQIIEVRYSGQLPKQYFKNLLSFHGASSVRVICKKHNLNGPCSECGV